MAAHLHGDLVAERAREIGRLRVVDHEPRIVPGRHAAVQERAVQEHRHHVVTGDAEDGRVPGMQVCDAHAFRAIAVNAGMDPPFQRDETAGMMNDVAVDIEHEDLVRLHRRLVGAAAGAEQDAVGAGHAHGHVSEHPDRALVIEHPRQGCRLAPQCRLVVHEHLVHSRNRTARIFRPGHRLPSTAFRSDRATFRRCRRRGCRSARRDRAATPGTRR